MGAPEEPDDFGRIVCVVYYFEIFKRRKQKGVPRKVSVSPPANRLTIVETWFGHVHNMTHRSQHGMITPNVTAGIH